MPKPTTGPHRVISLIALLFTAILFAACQSGGDTPDPSPATLEMEPAQPARAEPGAAQAAPSTLPAATSSDNTARGESLSAPAGETASPGNAGAAAPTSEQPDSSASDSTLAPTPASTPDSTIDALIYVQPQVVRQGGVILIAVDSAQAAAASVAFDGRFLSLTREGERLFALLPVAAATPPGPLEFVVAVAGADGRLLIQETLEVTVEDSNWATELVEIDEWNQRLLDPAVVAEDRIVREEMQRSHTPERLWRDFFRLPSTGGISSTFGVLRSYNGADPTDFHSGLDFAAPLGDDVLAPNEGRVLWTGETVRRGLGVVLDHGGGLLTVYWHLSSISIETGQAVTRGETIARVGNSGLSTGPHLHWEVVLHGVPVDPLPWLRELQVPDPGRFFDAASAVNAAPVGSTTTDPTTVVTSP